MDKKPLYEWYLHVPGVENLCLDVSNEANCHRVCEGAVEVYNLAADMGGMGFIERFRVECLRSILINTHMVEAAYKAGARRYFYSSSACAYNTLLQKDPKVRALKESDAYPAMAERGYGWEKLVSEMFCEEYWHERGMKTFIARFHNVYGPNGTWDGGREKAPAAMCRKVIEAIDKKDLSINIWGTGEQTRSFMYIDDCVKGIDMITHCDELDRDADQPRFKRTGFHQHASKQGGEDRRGEVQAHLQAGCAARRGRSQFGQHVHQEGAQVGAGHHLGQRSGRDLQVDQGPVSSPQGRQTRRHRVMKQSPVAKALGSIPNRLQLAGGWIDQPFVSRHNPKPPGSMVVVQIEPNFRPMDRSGIASGTRAVAMKLWKGRVPGRPLAELSRELYAAENQGKSRAKRFAGHDRLGLSRREPSGL